MDRPDLGDFDYVALQWKEYVLEQVIFKLSYEVQHCLELDMSASRL